MSEIQLLRRELHIAAAAVQSASLATARAEAERDRLRARLDRVLDALDPTVDLAPTTPTNETSAFAGGPL